MRPFVLALALQLAQPTAETRYCRVAPVRDSTGTIVRSRAVIAAFKRAHPCPANGARVGACPGWAIDHVIPLVCGGCDHVSNMQWLPAASKSARGTVPKDRWEQRVYCTPTTTR